MHTEDPKDSAGIGRRTIMTGAAWTIPAIALAAAAPAHAAASGLTLAFDKASYSGTLCTAITGAYVTATAGGLPVSGQSITLSLSNGFAFENGLSSYVSVSGTDGRVSVPSVRSKAGGSSGTLTAESSSVVSVATLTSAAGAANQTARYRIWDSSGTENTAAASNITVPTGTLAVGPRVTLTPDGILRRHTYQIATGVTSAIATFADQNSTSLTWVDGAGAHYRIWDSSGTENTAAASNITVPTGTLAVGPHVTLTPDGILRRHTYQIATGATSAIATFADQNSTSLTWVDGAC